MFERSIKCTRPHVVSSFNIVLLMHLLLLWLHSWSTAGKCAKGPLLRANLCGASQLCTARLERLQVRTYAHGTDHARLRSRSLRQATCCPHEAPNLAQQHALHGVPAISGIILRLPLQRQRQHASMRADRHVRANSPVPVLCESPTKQKHVNAAHLVRCLVQTVLC